uniref:glycine-rich protein n=1 Tax=Odoribacter lunatus TaxID=2941335 RepID=UPI002041B2A7
WDAAWVFLKYKKRGISEPWHHGYLARAGHEAMPQSGNEGGNYSFMFGQTGSGTSAKVTGVFLLRDEISDGNVSVRVRLKWLFKANTKKTLTAADFGDELNKIYVAVHAIEMVYIPYGSYYLGDNYSAYSFALSGKSPCLIDSEAAVTLNTVNSTSTSVTLPAAFPKGYAGFYIMKYETSQEQYMEFLNSLTLTQQKAHVTNNNFSTMNRGDYVFGSDLTTPTRRNGIVFIEQRGKDGPAVFGNNLNPANDLFSPDDGQTLACNQLSPYDMLAYCDWSGLRPMSELEYEKACRRPYPQIPEEGEYAWNSNSGVNPLTSESDLLYPGDEREQSVNKNHNVNSGGIIDGPVRCGLFATSSTNQTQSGATYWGVMDMSGNLNELCYIATSSGAGFVATNLTYSHGDGELNADGSTNISTSYWPNAVAAFGVRGGCYLNPDSLLYTSDRTKARGLTYSSFSKRFTDVGFRGVYGLSGIEINGGKISAPTTGCWSGSDLTNTQEASCPDFPDIRFQYNWYVKKPGEAKFDIISDASGVSLKYTNFVNNGTSTVTYQFKRVGTCAVGIAESNTVTISILPKPFAKSVYTFNAGSSVTLTPQYWGTNSSAVWTLDGAPSWAYVSGKTSTSLTIAGGLACVNFTIRAKLAACPSDEFSARVEIDGTFPYRGHMDSVKLAAGKYKMECWGAQGGSGAWNGNTSRGGYGGYAQGTANLGAITTYYVYVGERGGTSYTKTGGTGGWNGGGNGGGDEAAGNTGGGGGGGTDIRRGGQSLSSRIMVAGGGGGGSGKYGTGGSGGGTSGGYGQRYTTSTATSPGTQTSGYALGYGGTGTYGGSAMTGTGGGGGGYYGGYGAGAGPKSGSTYGVGGGGGSGYVNNSIFSNSSMSNGTSSGDGQVKITPQN